MRLPEKKHSNIKNYQKTFFGNGGFLFWEIAKQLFCFFLTREFGDFVFFCAKRHALTEFELSFILLFSFRGNRKILLEVFDDDGAAGKLHVNSVRRHWQASCTPRCRLSCQLVNLYRNMSFLFFPPWNKIWSGAGWATTKPVTRSATFLLLAQALFKMSKYIRKTLRALNRENIAFLGESRRRRTSSEVILIVQCKFTAISFDYV